MCVYGNLILLCSFLLKYLAVLYDGACVLFITGLIGLLYFCDFMYMLSFGAAGFMFIRYLLVCPLIHCIF